MTMNLLPWRQTAHRQNLRRFTGLVMLFVLLSLTAWWAMAYLNQQQKAQLSTQQAHFNQAHRRLQTLDAKIEQLRSALQEDVLVKTIPNEQVSAQLTHLAKLPFQQGELQFYQLRAEHIVLEGNTPAQQEFEQIHQYLTRHFAQVQLNQFQPSQQSLQFRFEVVLKEAQ